MMHPPAKFSPRNRRAAADAIAAGHKVYVADSPCPLGHFRRYAFNHACCSCAALSQANNDGHRVREHGREKWRAGVRAALEREAAEELALELDRLRTT